MKLSIRRILSTLNGAAVPIVFVGVLLSGVASHGGERQVPETIESGASCVDAGCHQDLKTGPNVHKPIAQDDEACELCHEAEGNRHAFSFPGEETELCYGCHDSVTEQKFVHFPLKEEENPCTVCHDPHVGAGKHLLRTKKAATLCVRCHSDVAEGELYHRSQAAGGCVACHLPHSAKSAKFLRADPPELCYTCHEDLKEDVSDARVVHGPMNAGCTACHHPHQAGAGKGLTRSGAALCVTCHADYVATAAQMKMHHAPPLEEGGCGRCHEPHAGNRKLLLRGDSASLCLTCHAKAIEAGDGRTIEGLGAVMVEGAALHGPLARKDCAGCHEPHANEQFRFLREAYPGTFYSPYSEDAYALCFACHDSSLAATRDTKNATSFRNGTVNLHAVHVNKTRKGRTCRACHAPHAGKNPHLLRDGAPFGQWEIPIKFAKSENGGTCDSGCHPTQSYDRLQPVVYGKAPASAPARDAAR